MAQPVIRVEGLGKEYVIGGRDAGRETFREMLTSSITAPFRRFRRLSGDVKPEERIWALKDVSFAIEQGEVVGIIGRNGAGKSTLLKILSRITEPTEGRAEIRGRVGSLLEVGTGFHPELTGRENIYLNGAILGMSHAEIGRKFDEIVDFAEVEKFLDTPVKRYSSGMAVRLAFAVAAHLDPEVLLVDEVLAVGDVEFQKKCLGKMESVAEMEGRTVVLVSHNVAALQAICTFGITLEDGRICGVGPVEEQIQAYLSRMGEHSGVEQFPMQLCEGLRLNSMRSVPSPVASGAAFNLNIVVQVGRTKNIRDFGVLVYSALGVRVGIFDLRAALPCTRINETSEWQIKVHVPRFNLVEGIYKIGLYISSSRISGDFLDLQTVTVMSKPLNSDYPPYPSKLLGIVDLECTAIVEPR